MAMRRFLKLQTLLFQGTITYKQIINELSPDKWVYEDLQSYVLTSKNLKNTSNIKFVNTSIKQLLNRLQIADGKNIWICGGASLVNQCIKENLIDEYQITTVPVILGSGIRLFEDNNKTINLKLKDLKEENSLTLGIYAKR